MDETENRIVPVGPASSLKRPPHPLDGQWHIHVNSEVYGPYTGHQLKDFIADGTMNGSTNVLRLGREDWTKAGEDDALAKLIRNGSTPAPPPAAFKAEKGAMIVQVTNQIGPTAIPGYLDDEAIGKKSPGTALVLSLLLCGVGQMYNGQVAKGILMMIGCLVLWIFSLGWLVNIWSMVDAYQTAKKINMRYHRRLLAGAGV